MDISEVLKQRKSIRKYQDKPVEKDKILKCLEAARIAPSACNSQPWHFVVLDNQEIKNNFANEVFSKVFSATSFAKKAPVLVAVISDKGNFASKVGNFVKDTSFYLIDLGIATEHFVLEAENQRLGTCWIGWFNEKKAHKFLNLPKSKKVDILIAVGYPDEKPNDRPRKKLQEMSSFNEYK